MIQTPYRSEVKECIVCHEIKPIEEYYKHPAMGDGYLGKCKACTKEQAKQRHYNKYATDPEFIERERERNREKYHRLGYRESQGEANRSKSYKDGFYKNLFKMLLRRGMITNKQNAHHWNYNQLDNIFILDKPDHRFIHTKIVLDKETLLFKDKDTGHTLYNLEDHFDLLEGYGIEYKHLIFNKDDE